MNRILNFLRDKAFIWIAALCVAAAAITGIWAIRTVRSRLSEDIQPKDVTGEEQYPGVENEEGDNTWQQNGIDVAGAASGVPEKEPASSRAAKESSASSGASSSASLPSEPSALQSSSAASADAAAPLYTQPVSGSILAAYSGDDLVYSKTLNDWRTHNGIDYACDSGESVFAPVSGTVQMVETDGNWGGVVTLADASDRVWRLCGIENVKLSAGDKVVTGQKLGTAGVIGCESSEKTHIHMEIKEGDRYSDPASLVH